jgi:[ribosomal protein S18]-alanine N-acetyltransferase
VARTRTPRCYCKSGYVDDRHRLTRDFNQENTPDLSPDISEVRLRAFEASDLPELQRLDARCFPPRIAYSRAELQFFIRHPRSTTTVAELQGGIVGFCVVDWKLESGRKVGHFITIDVAPELRRLGLGRLLMQAGETELAEMGCAGVALEVATNNTGALAFYEHLGYRSSGRIPGYYGDGTDALVLRKALTSPE